ncbi:metal-dependent hydrolase [Nocardia nova]|nr:metal-dependent hydrolase [Nocardia nova]
MTYDENSRSGSGTTTVTTRSRPGLPKPRRIRFGFGEAIPMPKYYTYGDIVQSHVWAQLSGGFPAGEESFIRSVRRFAGKIDDPVLEKRVAGFIGQEAMHGEEHRRLNRKLVELGYRITWLDSDRARRRRERFEEFLSPHVHLAMTAAAEHGTAMLAERILSSPEIQGIPMDPEVRKLLNWHAFEELEHKSVAFDVYRATGGSELLRIVTFGVALSLTISMFSIVTPLMLAGDPQARRQPARVIAQAYLLFSGPLFRHMLRESIKYMRPGFHPDDIDTSELLEQWREELFGAGGALEERLR